MKPVRLFFLLPLLAGPAHASEPERQAPFVTTPPAVVQRMLELAGTGPDDLVIDLGSGDGRIVIAAAQQFGARGLGIELDPRLVERSRGNARAAKVDERVSFVYDDVLAADISAATVVTAYLLPELLAKLEPRFITELKPGTRIVAHEFSMVGWRPDRTEQANGSTLRLWVVPADVRGVWRGGGWQLRMTQSYQDIEIEGGYPARLSGREIEWQSGSARFRGRVEGDRMTGELVTARGRQPLVLTRMR